MALLGVGAVYWLTIHPQVGRELAVWKRRAQAIPDPVLRTQALHKLTVERLNPEAAAFFAVLVAHRERPRVIRLIVAFQLLYDYIDAVNELPGATDMRNGLQLHGVLIDAVAPDRPLRDYYRHNPTRRDGGYLLALADTCKRIIGTLPSAASISPLFVSTTERCGQAQSYNHAITTEGELGFIDWCNKQGSGGDYLWWEIAAGGISCLAIHALFALAADAQGTIEEAERLDAVYFPSICAISGLLDSLADHDSDVGTTNHSFMAHYRDSTQAAERLVTITVEAADQVSGLRDRRRHIIILCGIVAFYLSSPAARAGSYLQVANELMQAAGVLARPMRMAMRLRRWASAHDGK